MTSCGLSPTESPQWRLGEDVSEKSPCSLSVGERVDATRAVQRTNESGDLGVDDATGEEVKVVLDGVHHHRVSCVVAALQKRHNTKASGGVQTSS